MKHPLRPAIEVLLATAVLATGACSGGGGGSGTSTAAPPASSGGTPTTAPSTKPATAGVWQGQIASTTTSTTDHLLALTNHQGDSVWMTTDGRVFHGELPIDGDHFDATLTGHMYEGDHFPDGTAEGPASMAVEHHSAIETRGRYSGSGDAGTFRMNPDAAWDRPAALGLVAGVYTRSTSNGYTMTLAIGSDGRLSGSDTRGCVVSGTVTVPDPLHDGYHLDAQISACGTLDGQYQGMGTLLDADAMRAWMEAMHPIEHGGHSHGGSPMGGHAGMGHNTVPGGQRNLFVFAMFAEHHAIMDALAR
jgi:hypothetical protein